MTVGNRRPPRIPAAARSLRIPIWELSQFRMLQRHGFDMTTPGAAEKITAMAEADPSPDNQLLLAASRAMKGNLQEALIASRAAADAMPDSARAQTTLATLLVNTGDIPGGLVAARRAAELEPEDPQVLYNLGLAESAAGNTVEGNTALTHAATLMHLKPRPWWRFW